MSCVWISVVCIVLLYSLCNGFAWDRDGDILGIIYQSSQLILWDANIEKKQTIDIGLRDVLTFMVWAKTGPILAIGTSKGNVSIYNHNTSKYVNYMVCPRKMNFG